MLGAEVRSTGALVGTAGGREMREEWGWNLDKERARLGGCESAVVVAWSGAATGAVDPSAFAPVALRCGSRLCPVCFAARAGRAMHRWGPVLDAALADGARVWHLTLTQRCEAVWGSAVLPREAGRWAGVVPTSAEVVVPAVAGESAGEAYARWRATWKALRNARWSEGSAGLGFLVGIEWTLRSKRGGRVQLPRWHCHGHVLAVATNPSWTPETMMRQWARLSGVDGRATKGTTRYGAPFIRYGAQYASVVESRQALVEVLKYPFKPGDVTAAAVLDAWSVLRGARTHAPAGGLHGSSTASKSEPWSRWLGVEREEQPWSLLEFEAPLGEGSVTWYHVTRDSLVLAGVPPGSPVRMRVKRADGSYHEFTDDPRRYSAIAAGHPVYSVGGDED